MPIIDFKAGDRITGTFLVKNKTVALTKVGATYWDIVLQDNSGMIVAKIWEPGHTDITPFEKFDIIEATGDVSSFNGNLQINIRSNTVIDKSTIDLKDYVPTSTRNIDEMFKELLTFADSVKNSYLRTILSLLFEQGDTEFVTAFKFSSAAKTIHHAFVGGLLEHTLGVVKNCDNFATCYPSLNRDLLITAAICHDIGKTRELTFFPENDFSDEGSLIGHIVIGTEIISDAIKVIPGFPETLATELKHCILTHHGELEFGSPKKPALIEAVALSFADNMDAKMAIFDSALAKTDIENPWTDYNRFFETSVKRTIG